MGFVIKLIATVQVPPIENMMKLPTGSTAFRNIVQRVLSFTYGRSLSDAECYSLMLNASRSEHQLT